MFAGVAGQAGDRCQNDDMPTALVTGSSSGIGAGFARRLAADGYALVLVARNGRRLDAMSADLLRAGAPDVEVLAADLTHPEQRDAVCERLADDLRPVDLLVNNAGIGLGKNFLASTRAELRGQVELNVTAVLELTRAALPGMTARGRGGIINISSIAALVPGRGSAYGATKAWVSSFSEAIGMDVRRSGVRVVAVHPGFVRSEFHERAGIDMSRTASVLYVPIKTVVDQSMRALWAGKTAVTPGPLYKVLVGAARLLPRALVRRIAARM